MDPASAQSGASFIMMFVTFFLGLIVSLVFLVLPFWFILKKAGFPRALSLLMFIPVVNFMIFFMLAFVDWPALKDKR